MPACTRDRTQPKSPQMSAVGCWISSGPESKRSSKPVRQGGHLLPSSLPSPPAASPPPSSPVAPPLFSPAAAPPLPSPPSPALSSPPTALPAASPTARVSTISSVSGLARLLVGALSMSNEGGKSIRRRARRRAPPRELAPVQHGQRERQRRKAADPMATIARPDAGGRELAFGASARPRPTCTRCSRWRPTGWRRGSGATWGRARRRRRARSSSPRCAGGWASSSAASSHATASAGCRTSACRGPSSSGACSAASSSGGAAAGASAALRAVRTPTSSSTNQAGPGRLADRA